MFLKWTLNFHAFSRNLQGIVRFAGACQNKWHGLPNGLAGNGVLIIGTRPPSFTFFVQGWRTPLATTVWGGVSTKMGQKSEGAATSPFPPV